jgi:hypothetical protein
MPQTTPDRAARWPGMDSQAIDYLQSRGYRLLRNWSWLLPEGKARPDEREEDAILYLIEEWDFDGWVTPASRIDNIMSGDHTPIPKGG